MLWLDQRKRNRFIGDLPKGKKVKDFSRGTKMKLAIAVALSHKAKLLVLDEATGGLDPVVRDEILDLLNDFTREEEHAILLSSHIVTDLGEIQNLTVQVAGIGNNLNQIARYFHSGGLASRGMLEELKRCIAEIRELRQEIVQIGGVYRGNPKTHRK